MSDWNPRVGRNRDRGTNSWSDLERNPGFEEYFGFFGAAAKHKRIAPLQAYDQLTLFSPTHDQVIDFGLGKSMGGSLFTRVHDLGVRARPVQYFRITKVVIDDHVSLFSRFLGSYLPQSDISRPAPPYNPFTFL